MRLRPRAVPAGRLNLIDAPGGAKIPTLSAADIVSTLEFVTIHPFMDGNGRLGRLLMNHALLSAGLPWVTIRSDERVPFFKAIEHAQVDGDAVPFIRFVWHLIQQSAMDLQRKQSGRKAARKTPRRRPV
jgi:Fic family protein